MKYRIDLLWEEQKDTKQTVAQTQIAEVKAIDLFAATLGITQKRLLLFKLKNGTKVSETQIRKFKGVEIQLIDNENYYSLAIILLEDALMDIFTRLADDIVESLSVAENESSAIKKLFKIISQWKRLFEKGQLNILSSEEQKGLYGELLMFKLLLESGNDPKKLLEAWSGPDKKNQDFMFSAVSLEVKTTTANHPIIRITNELQLASDKFLFLVLFILNEQRGNLHTLPTLVGILRKVISDIEPLCEEIFEEKLQSINYYDDDAIHYSTTEYSIREVKCYNVDEHFPRLVPANLADGIFNVGYQIEVSSCAESLVNYPETITEHLNNEKSD